MNDTHLVSNIPWYNLFIVKEKKWSRAYSKLQDKNRVTVCFSVELCSWIHGPFEQRLTSKIKMNSFPHIRRLSKLYTCTLMLEIGYDKYDVLTFGLYPQVKNRKSRAIFADWFISKNDLSWKPQVCDFILQEYNFLSFHQHLLLQLMNK